MEMTWRAARALSRAQTAHPAGFFAARETLASDVLERAGLIKRAVGRQRRPVRLKAAPMAEAVRWLEEFEQFWAGSFDQLDNLLEDLKQSRTKRESDNE